MSRKREYTECPHCGADVVVGSKACRECGSDASTGWQGSEEIDYQSIEVPDGYADAHGTPARTGVPRWVRIVALLLAIALAYLLVRGVF